MPTSICTRLPPIASVCLRWRDASMVLCISWLVVLAASSQAAAFNSPNPCIAAAQRAAAQTGVPLALLKAIARTESGRSNNGKVEPWPWAMNLRGTGVWHPDRASLLDSALAQIAKGERLFDLGCFQINYHWHESSFDSLDAMISPDGNALYAAQFLKALFHETGDWTEAAGYYHSRTEELASAYKQRLAAHINGFADDPVWRAPHLTAPGAPKAPRRNSFPLLTSRAGRPQLGSLVVGMTE